jgi:hypothetical protein
MRAVCLVCNIAQKCHDIHVPSLAPAWTYGIQMAVQTTCTYIGRGMLIMFGPSLDMPPHPLHPFTAQACSRWHPGMATRAYAYTGRCGPLLRCCSPACLGGAQGGSGGTERGSMPQYQPAGSAQHKTYPALHPQRLVCRPTAMGGSNNASRLPMSSGAEPLPPCHRHVPAGGACSLLMYSTKETCGTAAPCTHHPLH